MDFFADSLRDFVQMRPILEFARGVELSRLSAFVAGVHANVSRVEGRVKDSVSIRENFVRYRGAPVSSVSTAELFESCSDLIGLRVVVMYDSDVDIVTDYLSKSYGSNFSQVFTVADLVGGSEFGYRASHWKFAFEDVAFERHFRGLPVMCEVQVRTILSDAWAQHSHKMIYKNPAVSHNQERVFARTAAALEAIDDVLNQLNMRDEIPDSPREAREDISTALARKEVFEFLRGSVKSSLSDAAIESVIDQAATHGLVKPEDRLIFLEEVKKGFSLSSSEKFKEFGIIDELTRLKIGIFWVNQLKYKSLVPPHLLTKALDMFLVR